MHSSRTTNSWARTRRRLAGQLATLLVLATVSSAAAAATAEDSDATAPPGQRRFGVGATAGVYAGTGITMGGGGRLLKGWFSAGYIPVLVFANARTNDHAMRFNYYTSYQINEDLALHLLTLPRVELALIIGYKYNTVLRHGGGIGVGGAYALGRRVGLQMSAGVALFPHAKDHLDHDQGYPVDRVPALTPALQGGVNVGLVFFP